MKHWEGRKAVGQFDIEFKGISEEKQEMLFSVSVVIETSPEERIVEYLLHFNPEKKIVTDFDIITPNSVDMKVLIWGNELTQTMSESLALIAAAHKEVK